MSQTLKKTMLIIKSDANALKGVEQFLKNRDWQLTSTHQMKTAVMCLVQQKPSFVLISVDHSNKKMMKLPKVVASAFPCCVMVFAEKSTTASFKMLMDSGLEYKINPPLTGPAIERAVNKYLRDQELASRQKEQNPEGTLESNGKGNFDFSVEVKSGGDGQQAGFVSMSAGAAAQENSLAQSLLAQLGADDEMAGIAGALSGSGSSGAASPTKDSSGGSVINFQKAKSQQDPQSSDPGTLSAKGPNGAKSGSPSAGGELSGMGSGKKSGPGYRGDQDGGAGEDIMIGQAKSRGKSNGSSEPVSGEANDLYVPPDSKKPGDLPQPQSPGKKSSDQPVIAREIDEETGKRKPTQNKDEIHVKDGGFFDEESVFIKGVNQTLDDTLVKTDGMVQEHLEDNTHLACIVVDSTKFSGYLVAAIGKDKKFDDNFVEMVRAKLTKFLRDNGEPIEAEENLQLKIQKVDFEGWALEYAQFLRKSVHKGDQVAMAFFPFADAQTKVGASAVSTMVSVKTTEIQTETPLEFNMYMYLPTNKKYILYTPKGGQFLEKQKQKLMKQGMMNMHIKKEDVQNLGKFKAQNHLNSLVDQHHQKAKTKKSAG